MTAATFSSARSPGSRSPTGSCLSWSGPDWPRRFGGRSSRHRGCATSSIGASCGGGSSSRGTLPCSKRLQVLDEIALGGFGQVRPIVVAGVGVARKRAIERKAPLVLVAHVLEVIDPRSNMEGSGAGGRRREQYPHRADGAVVEIRRPGPDAGKVSSQVLARAAKRRLWRLVP